MQIFNELSIEIIRIFEFFIIMDRGSSQWILPIYNVTLDLINGY